MDTLVIYCHPDSRSFCRYMRDAVVRGMSVAGHNVRTIDLYADNFNPVMSADDHRNYLDESRGVADDIARYVSLIKTSEILVFVYPTWWGTTPAMLKGWLERVLIPGVGFSLNKKNKVTPGLSHVKKIVGVTSYGSPWWYVRLVNDGGRRTLHRSLRGSTGLRTKTRWFGFYGIDGASNKRRLDFLANLEKAAATI